MTNTDLTPAMTDALPPRPVHRIGLRWTNDTHRPGPRLPINDDYVEQFWLPVIGPTSVLAIRLLDRMRPTRYAGRTEWYEPAELAFALGLGNGHHRNSPLIRTLHRLHRFGLLQRCDDQPSDTEVVTIPTLIHPVPASQRIDWPEWFATAHDHTIHTLIRSGRP